jgi:hypothetical protein
MQITRITTTKNPDRVKRKVLLNTDDLKLKFKELPDKINELNEAAHDKIDKLTGRIVNIAG